MGYLEDWRCCVEFRFKHVECERLWDTQDTVLKAARQPVVAFRKQWRRAISLHPPDQ